MKKERENPARKSIRRRDTGNSGAAKADVLKKKPLMDVPGVDDPRICNALLLYLNGEKKKDIAKRLGVHPRTAGRWINKFKNKITVDVHSGSYLDVFMGAIEEHGEIMIAYKLAYIEARKRGDGQTAYAYARRFETSLKRRDRAIEKLGVKFKSRIEQENEELKSIIAYFIILSERLDENLFAREKGKKKPWDSPFNISVHDINRLKDCPELFDLERYLTGVKKDTGTGYFDRYDLEMAITAICVLDPDFNVERDDPAAFAARKLFNGNLLREER